MTASWLPPALLLAAVLGGCTTPGARDDAGAPPPRVERLAAACEGCHGPDGMGSDAMPALRGLSSAYTTARLNAWREAEDSQGRDHVMVRFARTLSEEDVRALAAWYAEETP